MKQEKEKRMEEIMESISGIQRAEANPFLFEKIISKIEAQKNETVVISSSWKIRWAVVSLVVLLLNGISFFHFIKSSSSTGNTKSENIYTEISTEMGFSSSYNY